MKECGGGSWDKMLFRLYDVDNSGFITTSDYKIVELPGQFLSQHWDRNGDGKISFEEFLKRQV